MKDVKRNKFINRILVATLSVMMAITFIPASFVAFAAEPEDELTEVTVKKVWEDEDNKDGMRPEQLHVYLNDEYDSEVVLSEENGWEMTISDLPVYDDTGAKIKYEWSEEEPEGYELVATMIDGTVTTLVNKYVLEEEETEATIRKEWDDEDDRDGVRPEELTVVLNDEEKTEVILNEENDWTDTVSGLPKYDEYGDEIKYEWTEEEMPDYYELSDTVVKGTVTTLTNTYVPEETEATVRKVWNDEDNKYGKRPESLTVVLDDEDETEVVLSEANNWEATVSELPRYEYGEEAEYEWSEEEMPEGYELTEVTYEGTVTILTNTYTGEPAAAAPDEPAAEETAKDDSEGGAEGTDQSAGTGDDTNITGSLALLLLAAFGCGAVFLTGRRRNN